MRERARGSQILGQTFSKKRGRVLEETEHTLIFLPQGKKEATKLAKRDVAKAISPPPPEGAGRKEEKECGRCQRDAERSGYNGINVGR